MKTIDLNCDMGEVPEAVFGGAQGALMDCVTSVNIACGGHAGDASTMQATIEQALARGRAIGAHPGYPDAENFGRLEMCFSAAEIADIVYAQVSALVGIATRCGARVTHVKAHGALYNQAVKDGAIAQGIADGVARWSREAVLVGLAGSPMLEVFEKNGFRIAAEAFADRRYEPDGTLRSRKFPDALIRDPAEAAEHALKIVQSGHPAAQTICIHGDTPGALDIAYAVAGRLCSAGVRLESLG